MRQASRKRLMSATALVGATVLFAHPAAGQIAPPAADQSSSAPGADVKTQSVEDIVVTGTRIVRNGYQSPTPVSVLGSDEIAAKALINVADVVNQLPALQGSITPRANMAGLSAGNNGINALNLRNLGVARTLVLLDGQRVGASSINGYVDIDQFPQALIKRVDITTGGASADFGSDAVAGVVNFVLDRTFTGIKGDATGGVTTYGDDRDYKVSLTAGTSFADGRGHILLSGEFAHNDGISGIGSRKWYNYSKIFANPNYTATNGQPQFLSRANSGFQNATPGGIISSGPLRGIYFGQGGTPSQFQYGPVIGGNIMQGGQYQYADWGTTMDLDPRLGRQNAFGYISYDLTEHIQAFAQLSWGRATYHTTFGTLPKYGAVTITTDNAFLPASVAAQAAALGVTSFNLGTLNTELGPITANTTRRSIRPVIGLRGDFDAFGKKWSWDVSGESTISRSYVETNNGISANYSNAIDSVRAANGTIVCRVTLTNPNSGCVPYNVFGTGVNSSAATNYINGTAWIRTRLRQDVVQANLRGSPFETWAGPVSVAMGVEHRREKVSGVVDALDAASQANSLATGTARIPPYFTGNYLPSFGAYNVTEGYFQTVVPLAKDTGFAKNLDLLAGVRGTSYSTSGYVTTWKAGLTYKPISDITFRVTRSRDIRAPNLSELFQSPQATLVTFTDTIRNSASSTGYQITSGNQNLKPEKADTFGGGVVVQPSFIPGFAASVDYWSVDIKDAITTLQGQQLINQCASGNATFCSQITRNTAGAIANVAILPVNFAKQVARGLDFEASYRRPIFGGSFQIRALATRNLKNVTSNGITAPVTILGKNQGNNADGSTLPYWSYNATVSFDKGPVFLLLTARGFSAGKYNPMYVECTSNCPTSTGDHPTIENNRLPGATYFDANVTFKIGKGLETFVSVTNLLNKDPAQVPWTAGGAPISIDRTLYDTLGRVFHAGVRFKL